MREVTIEVSGWDVAKTRFEAAFRGEPQGEFISFASMDMLWKTLSPRKLELLRAMAGKEAMSLRAVARLLGKDIKTTHEDVHNLLRSRILEKTEDGKILFPYDVVHVGFTFTAAA